MWPTMPRHRMRRRAQNPFRSTGLALTEAWNSCQPHAFRMQNPSTCGDPMKSLPANAAATAILAAPPLLPSRR